MKFYLSSFKFGNKKAQLIKLAPKNKIAINRGIEYCEGHGIKYRAIRDDDVIII